MKRLSISFVLMFLFFVFGLSAQDQKVRIMIVYDNYQFSEHTIADWGFSCVVIKGIDTILFDTGARKDIFFHNLKTMDIDLSKIHTTVISHFHGDHSGNIFPVVETNPDMCVFLPSCMKGKFRSMVESYGARTEYSPEIRQLAHDIFLSQEMGFQIREKCLVVKSSKGLILITGCSHPGVERMVRKVCKAFDEKVYMVIGGCHMEDFTDPEIDEVINDLRAYGVQKIAPGHCTGKRAMEKLRKAFKHNFIRSGTGKIIEI